MTAISTSMVGKNQWQDAFVSADVLLANWSTPLSKRSPTETGENIVQVPQGWATILFRLANDAIASTVARNTRIHMSKLDLQGMSGLQTVREQLMLDHRVTSEDYRHADTYEQAMQELADLLEDTDDELGSVVPPTRETLRRTRDFLDKTRRQLLRSGFPRTGFSEDGYGGVYMYWWRPERSFQLHIPRSMDERVSLYMRDDSGSRMVTGASPSDLVDAYNEFEQH